MKNYKYALILISIFYTLKCVGENNRVINVFNFGGYELAEVVFEEDFFIKDSLMKQGAYLVYSPTLEENTKTLTDLNKIKSLVSICEYCIEMGRSIFTDISDELKLTDKIVIRYAFHDTGGPGDLSMNKLYCIKDSTIQLLANFVHWDYCRNPLNIHNDNSEYSYIKYTSRDREYSYFHDDYLIQINRNTLEAKEITPNCQQMNFHSTLLEDIKIFKSKESVGKQTSNTFNVEKGKSFTIDSIYWNERILKIRIYEGNSGYVSTSEIYKSIMNNNAG